jgi:predicted O-methyltransferase YrrM
MTADRAVRSRVQATKEAPIDPEPTHVRSATVDPVVLHTMTWSAEFAVPCVMPATGAVLRLLAAGTRARSVVEVGTGLGVSGLWLLQGLAADAVLTTIDIEIDHQAMARQAFAAAEAAGFGAPRDEVSPARTRLIAGPAKQVLDRLADGSYDLVFVDMDDHPLCTDAARRLLRPAGLLVLHQPTAEDHARLSGREWAAAQLGPDLLAATRRS